MLWPWVASGLQRFRTVLACLQLIRAQQRAVIKPMAIFIEGKPGFGWAFPCIGARSYYPRTLHTGSSAHSASRFSSSSRKPFKDNSTVVVLCVPIPNKRR